MVTHINLNDGRIAHNLVFSTCRESGDHGPFNSWDRVPYISTLRHGPGKPSVLPAP